MTLRPMLGPVAAIGLLLTITASTVAREHIQPAVNPRGAAIKAFLDRVAAYDALHKKVAASVPPLRETDDAAKVTAREVTLGDAIASARPNAQIGELFGTDFGPIARQIVRSDWARRAAADRRALVGELPPKTPVRVNVRYPSGYPLLTMPATLLKELPDLPDPLEYRLFGRHLILRDAKANILVDILTDALPPTS